MPAPLHPGDRVHHTGIPISRGTLVETYTARVPGQRGRTIDAAVVRWDGTPGTYTHRLSKQATPVRHTSAPLTEQEAKAQHTPRLSDAEPALWPRTEEEEAEEMRLYGDPQH